MFQHVLVPLDGSERAEHALPVATRIARVGGGLVLLVQVVNPLIDYGGGLAPVPLVTEQVVESEMAQASDYLTRVASSAALAGIETRTEALFGETVQALLSAVSAYSVDLVVMVNHGRTGLERWALGSVAYRLVHRIPVPLFILREGHLAAALTQGSTDRPLAAQVALDGSLLAEAALLPAIQLVTALAAPGSAALHLTQVVQPFSQASEEGTADEREQEKVPRANSYLATVKKRLEETLPAPRPEITCSVALDADVASALIRVAEQGEGRAGVGSSAVIAMSTHGRGGVQRLLMGSVTHRVLEATKLPMLVIKPVQLATGLA